MNVCSCGLGTSSEQYLADLSSPDTVCRACARHDKSLEGETSMSVVFGHFRTDDELVTDLWQAKGSSLKTEAARLAGIAYYTIHNRILPLKRSFMDIEPIPVHFARANLKRPKPALLGNTHYNVRDNRTGSTGSASFKTNKKPKKTFGKKSIKGKPAKKKRKK